MKRLISIVQCLLACFVLSAQPSLGELADKLATNKIEAEFSCVYKADVPINYSGRVTAQDNCFHAVINGLESYCDGTRLVIVDKESKEIYIESARGLEAFLKSNIKNVSSLKFSSLELSEKSKDLSSFTVDCASYGAEWVITDLRQE